MRRVLPAVVMLAALLTTGAANADARKARAAAEKGTKLYNLNRFDEALKEYADAYLEKKDPVFLYNIGQCHRQLGNKPEAIRFYKNFLRDAPDAVNRAEVGKRIVDLEEAIAAEEKARNAPSTATIEPTPGGPEPSPPPGPDLSAPPPVETVAAPPPQPAPAESSSVLKKWWFWTAIGAVVVTAAVVGIAASGGGKDPGCPEGTVCK